MLSILHEARMQFLKHYGFDEKNFWGVGLIMGDVAIEFKKELFYGDMAMISVTAANFERVSFDLWYQLETIRDGKRILIANAKTGMICFNYDTRKITSVPQEAIEKLSVQKKVPDQND